MTYTCFDKLEMIVVKSKIVVTNVQKHVHIHLKNVYIYIWKMYSNALLKHVIKEFIFF